MADETRRRFIGKMLAFIGIGIAAPKALKAEPKGLALQESIDRKMREIYLPGGLPSMVEPEHLPWGEAWAQFMLHVEKFPDAKRAVITHWQDNDSHNLKDAIYLHTTHPEYIRDFEANLIMLVGMEELPGAECEKYVRACKNCLRAKPEGGPYRLIVVGPFPT